MLVATNMREGCDHLMLLLRMRLMRSGVSMDPFLWGPSKRWTFIPCIAAANIMGSSSWDSPINRAMPFLRGSPLKNTDHMTNMGRKGRQ